MLNQAWNKTREKWQICQPVRLKTYIFTRSCNNGVGAVQEAVVDIEKVKSKPKVVKRSWSAVLKKRVIVCGTADLTEL